MWSRWFLLSMFLPSQQLGKSWMRSTLLPSGQIGYLLITVFRSNPPQLQDSRAFLVPLTDTLASPVSTRRNLGIAPTSLIGLPRKVRSTDTGRWTSPSLPSNSFLSSTPLGGFFLAGSCWPSSVWSPLPLASPAAASAHAARPLRSR